MNSKRDRQFCAFESATGSSAQTLALFADMSLWETIRNSLERRTICDANPEISSSLEASLKGLGVVTGWDISSARDSRRGATRRQLGEGTRRLNSNLYTRIGRPGTCSMAVSARSPMSVHGP